MMKLRSTKLTNDCRISILNQIIKESFSDRKEKIEEERLAFSEIVYNDLYNEKTRRTMESLPERWLPKSDYFFIQLGSDGAGYCRRAFNSPKLFLAKHKEGHRQCLKVYDGGHELSKRHADLTRSFDELAVIITNAQNQARAILNSCSTTKQLKDCWPEITKYVEQYEPTESRTTAIAPVTKGLNDMLSLSAEG